MKPAKRKIISLFFILLGLTPLLYLFILTVKKYEIRHRMKEKLEEQTLQIIILPEGEVVWMDKHEIWVNGHMFDVHSKKLENGFYTFTGLYDDEETNLVINENKSREKTDENDKILSKLFQCIHTIFYNRLSCTSGFTFLNDHIPSLIAGAAITQFKEILTPPPQVSV